MNSIYSPNVCIKLGRAVTFMKYFASVVFSISTENFNLE